MKNRFKYILSSNFMRRVSALLMCLCIILSSAPVYGDNNIYQAPVPIKSEELSLWCNDNTLTVKLFKANGAEVKPNEVLKIGEEIRFAISFELKATAIEHFDQNDVLYYDMPDGIQFRSFSGSDNKGCLAISANEGSNRLEIRFLENFFKHGEGDYSVAINLAGSIYPQEGSTQGSYSFSANSSINVRFDNSINAYKQCITQIFKDTDNKYYADFGITIENPLDLTYIRLEDCPGEYLTIMPETLKLDGSSDGIRYQLVSGSAKNYFFYIDGGLPKGTHTITYRTQIKQEAIEQHQLVWNTNEAPRGNNVFIKYETQYGSGSIERWGSVSYDDRAFRKLEKSNHGIQIDERGKYVEYTVHFPVDDHVVENATLVDVRGGALGGTVSNVQWLYHHVNNTDQQQANLNFGDNPINQRIGSVKVTQDNNKLTFVMTDVCIGFHYLKYRVYLDNADLIKENDVDGRTNTATLTGDGSVFTATSAVSNRLALSKEHRSITAVMTDGNATHYDVEYRIILDNLIGYGINNVSITDTFDPQAELQMPVNLVRENGEIVNSITQPGGMLTSTPGQFVLEYDGISCTDNKLYVVYKLRVPAELLMSENGFRNTARADGQEGYDDYKYGKGIPGVTKSILNTNTLSDPMEVTWEGTISIPEPFMNFKVVDYPGPHYTENNAITPAKNIPDSSKYVWFDKSKLNLTIKMGDRTLTEGIDYTVSFDKPNEKFHENGRMTIDFLTEVNQDLRLTYTSLCSKEAVLETSVYYAKFYNSLLARYYEGKNERWSYGNATWQWLENIGYIHKTVDDIKGDGDAKTGNNGFWRDNEDGTRDYIIQWRLHRNDSFSAPIDLCIVDVLPKGLTYVEGSLKAYNNHWEKFPLDPFTFDEPTFDEQGRQVLTFRFSKKANDNGFRIIYETRVDESLLDMMNGYDLMFKNLALMYNGDQTHFISLANAETHEVYTVEKPLDKSAALSEDKSRITYTVDINPNGIDIDPSDSLYLEDILHEQVYYLPLTKLFEVGADGNRREMSSSEYTLSYDYYSNKLALTVPDQKHLVLEFQVGLRVPAGTDVNISNTITMSGYYDSSENQRFAVGNSSVVVNRRGCTLEVNKIDEETGIKIKGAEFSVYQVDVVDGKKSILRNKIEAHGTTDRNGYVRLPDGSSLAPDTLYYIEETKAAPGYENKGVGAYLLFAGNDKVTRDERIKAVGSDKLWLFSGSTSIDLTNKKTNSIDIQFGKKWNDGGFEDKRPGSVEITLWRKAAGISEVVPVSDGQSNPICFNFDSSNSSEYVFSDTLSGLAISDADGNTYEYYVTEKMFNGADGTGGAFNSNRYAQSTEGYYAVNTYKRPEIKIFKQLTGIGSSDIINSIEPDIHFKLYAVNENGSQGDLLHEFTINDDLRPYTLSNSIHALNSDVWDFGKTYMLVETNSPYVRAKLNGSNDETLFEPCGPIKFTISNDSNSGTGTRITILDGGGAASANNELNQITVANRKKDSDIDVVVNKLWKDANGDYFMPEGVSAQFKLQQSLDGGATFNDIILDMNDHDMNIAQITLPQNGNYTGKWENLPIVVGSSKATYRVVETNIADGYTGTESFIIDPDTGNIVYTFTNTRKVRFNIVKTDMDGAPINGIAKFSLYRWNNGSYGELVRTWQSNNQYDSAFVGLTGYFMLVENTAPAGYAKSPAVYFRVDEDGVITEEAEPSSGASNVNGFYDITDTTITMKDAPVSFTITKRMADGAALPNGIELSLECYNEQNNWVAQGTWTSGTSTSPWQVSGETGLFRISETAVPKGVKPIDGHVYFYVDELGSLSESIPSQFDTLITDVADSAAYSINGSNAEVVLINSTFKVEVQKTFVDEAGNAITENLPTDAVLKLFEKNSYDTNGEDADALCTINVDGSNGNTFDITQHVEIGGEYVLCESTPSVGYNLAAPVTFTVAADGKVNGTSVVEIINKRNLSFNILKTDMNGVQIAGALLELSYYNTETRTKGASIRQWTSSADSSELFSGIIGSFILEEVTPPAGYKTAAPVVFNIDKYGIMTDENGAPISGAAAVMKDAPFTIKLRKVFRELDGTAAASIPSGVVLKVLTDDAEMNQIAEFNVSAQNDVYELTAAEMAGIQAGKTYILRETVPGSGFAQAADIRFTVKGDGTVSYTGAPEPNTDTVTMYNDRTISFKLMKLDESGRGLGGAELQLKKLVDGAWQPAEKAGANGTWTSTADPITVSGEYGRFMLSETKAPNGYTLAAPVYFEVKPDGTVLYTDENGTAGSAVSRDINGIAVISITDAKLNIKVEKRFLLADGRTADGNAPDGTVLSVYEQGGSVCLDTFTVTNNNKEFVLTADKYIAGGKYKLVESVSGEALAEGYSALPDILFEISEDGLSVTYTGDVSESVSADGDKLIITNRREVRFGVYKTDDNDAPLDGVKFELIKKTELDGTAASESKKWQWTTDSINNPFTVNNETGTFELTEIGVPAGYTIHAPVTFTVNSDTTVTLAQNTSGVSVSGDVIKKLSVTNTTFDISFRKLFGGTVAEGEYAVISVVDMLGNTIDTWSTNGSDTLRLHDGKKLSVNTRYKLVETSAPSGFVKSAEIPFYVSGEGIVYYGVMPDTSREAQGNVVEMTNALAEFEVLKVDENGSPLANAGLALYKGELTDDALIEAWTSTEQPKVFTGLTGIFTLVEQSVPSEFYKQAEPIVFEVKDDGKVYLSGSSEPLDTARVVMTNTSIGTTSIEVIKLWESYGSTTANGSAIDYPSITVKLLRSIDGKSFEPVMNNGAEVTETLTAPEWKHTFVNLPEKNKQGTPYIYNIEEIVAEGSSYTPEYSREGNKITIKNIMSTVDGEFSKKAVGGTDELPGASMRIVEWNGSAEGDEIDKWTSGDKAHKLSYDKFVIGKTYRLIEDAAPDGYQKAQHIDFKVEMDGNTVVFTPLNGGDIDGRKVTMYDEPNKVVIVKRFYTSGGELAVGFTGKAVLRLFNAANEQIGGDITAENGVEVTIKSPMLIPGEKYTLKEISTPENYKLAASVEFTYNADGTITYANATGSEAAVTLDNRWMEFKVGKTDESGNYISGAELKLSRIVDGVSQIIDTWTTGTNENDNPKTFKGTGKYVLSETTAPDGYLVSESACFTVSTDGTITLDPADGETSGAVNNNTATVVMRDKLIELVDINVEKIWQDYSNGRTQHPEITVYLMRSINGGAASRVIDASGEEVKLTLNDTTGWSGSFTELPATDASGSAYEYSVTESMVSGYEEPVYTRTEQNGVISYTITNNTETVDGVFSKKAVGGTAELPGASLRVVEWIGGAEGAEVDRWISGAERRIPYDKFVIGRTYRLIETEPPAGYAKAGYIEFTVEKKDNTVVFTPADSASEVSVRTVTMRDKPINVNVSKVLIKDGVVFTGAWTSGAVLQILDSDGKIIANLTVTSSEPTPVVLTEEFSFIVGGTYTLHEVSAPEGYKLAKDISFTIEDDGTVSYLDESGTPVSGAATVVMNDRELEFTVEKLNEKNVRMSGATLKLERKASGAYAPVVMDGLVNGSWTTDAGNNPLTVKGMKGEFRLSEIGAPDNYSFASSIEFTVDDNGQVYLKGGDAPESTAAIKMNNSLRGRTSVQVSKSWEHFGSIPENAEPNYPTVTVNLYRKPETKADFDFEAAPYKTLMLSKENGWSGAFTDLEKAAQDGTPYEYTVREGACDGYTLNEIKLTSDDENGYSFVLSNYKNSVDGSFSKVTLQNGAYTEISGAKMEIRTELDTEDASLPHWESGSEPHRITLDDYQFEIGKTYWLVETLPPAGYLKAEPVQFTVQLSADKRSVEFVKVSGDGEAAGRKIMMIDKPFEASVVKTFVDADNTSADLPATANGAVLRVYELDAQGNKLTPHVCELVNVRNSEPLKLSGIRPETDYVIVEETTPYGFVKANDITFRVNADGTVSYKDNDNVSSIRIENRKVRFIVEKVDEDGQPLQGAELTLTQTEGGKFTETWLTNASNNPHVFDGLVGSFVLHESKAPAGMLLAEDVKFTVAEDGTVSLDGDNGSVDGITITMVDESISFTAREAYKAWDEKKSKYDVPHEPVQIRLYRKLFGETEFTPVPGMDAVEIGSDGINWYHKFDNLPATDASGNAIEYAVAEEPVPEGYTVTYQPRGELAVDVVNTTDYVDGEFSKTDISGNTELPGAQLKIVDADANTVGEPWTSTDAPYLLPLKLLKIGEAYRLVEITPPKGYTLAQEMPFTVRLDPVSGDVTFVNGTDDYGRKIVMKDSPIDIAVRKHIGDGTTLVKGATLKLTDITNANENPVYFTTTDSGDWAIGEYLRVGHTYRVEETVTPAGYITAEPVEFTVDSNGNAHVPGNVNAKFADNRIPMTDTPFGVAVYKKDGNTFAVLEGAEFALYEGEIADGADVSKLTPVEAWTTDASGYHAVDKKLVYGNTYTIVETKAPLYYKKAGNLTFTLDKSAFEGIAQGAGFKLVLELTVFNEMITASFAKLDASVEPMTPLAEVGLTLTCAELPDFKEQWTTKGSVNETHVVSGLVVGNTYTLTETAAPAGFRRAEPISFKVMEDGSLINTETGAVITGNAVVMLNSLIGTTAYSVEKAWDEHGLKYYSHPEITVQLTRKYLDELNDASVPYADVPGASVKLNAGNDWLHTFTNLPETDTEGRRYAYSAYETDVPADYTVSYLPGTMSIKITNTTDYYRLSFDKRAVNGSASIAGARFRISNAESGAELCVFTTKTSPTWIDAKLFKANTVYKLEELAPPAGYALCEAFIKFKVEPDVNGKPSIVIVEGGNAGGAIGDLLYMEDKPLDIEVLKVDENGKPLAGATLELYEGKSANGAPIVRWISGTTPMSLRSFAARGYLFKRGTYYTLSEAAAPNGYAPAEAVTFTIDTASTAAVKSISFKNTAMKLTISKTNSAGTKVEGAQLALYNAPYRSGDKPIESWTTGKADHDVTGVLVYGRKYVLREESAPKGHIAAADIEFTLDKKFIEKRGVLDRKDGVMRISITMVDPRTGVAIIKADEQTGKPLAGANLSLYEGNTASSSKLIESWTSTETAKTFVGVLEVGKTYLLTETQAPSGYFTAASKTFTVTAEHSESNPLSITMNDPHLYSFRKESAVTGKPVSGATLGIFDSEGKELDRWTTAGEESHQIVGRLKPGKTYTLRELIVPAGYKAAAPVTFSVNHDGWLVYGDNPASTNKVAIVTLVNHPNTTTEPPTPPPELDLTITKRWDDSGNALGIRPRSITVKLFRKLSIDTTYPLTPYLTVQISGGSNETTWSFTFYGLERYNGSGMSYDYMAREEAVEGYEVRYVNEGRTIINSLPEQATPTPTLPGVSPTPTPTSTVPRGLRKIGDEWVYIDDDGVPLGITPQTGDDTDWLLWGLAIVLPLIMAALLAVEIQRRKKRASVKAHRNDG